MTDEEILNKRLQAKEKRAWVIISILAACIVAIYIFSLFYGVGDIPVSNIINVLFGDGGTWGEHYIVFRMRMPRTACAAMVGAGLAVSGMAMQALFRNPMASPSVLGLSSGSAFGANIAIAFGVGAFLGTYAVPAMAFIFCMLTMALVYIIATTRHGTPVILLLLAGVAISSFFGGLTSLLHYIVDAETLQNIVYWTLGGFDRCYWSQFKQAVPVITIGVILICTCTKELNLISLGEEQAETLGVNARRVKIQLLVGTSMTVGGCVAISGVIGFVGLIIPHICRALCGPNHKIMAPMCILVGAIFMMLMDTISRCGLLSSMDLPVGVLTSLLGAPFFIYIMRKKKNDFW